MKKTKELWPHLAKGATRKRNCVDARVKRLAASLRQAQADARYIHDRLRTESSYDLRATADAAREMLAKLSDSRSAE